MLDALKALDLHGAAHALGVHPFEVVRLLVMSGSAVDPVTIPRERIDALRSFGEIEDWWTEGKLPADANAQRAVVRGMLAALVERGLVGERSTRLDNLSRGLDAAGQETAESAVMTLLELGYLTNLAAPSGVRVAIHPDALDAVKKIATGGEAPAALSALWGG